MEELEKKEVSRETSKVLTVEVDHNSISETGPVFGNDIQTKPDKVYRQVSGLSALEDIYDTGVVRSSTSAKNEKDIERTNNSKGSKQIYWTRGKEGKGHTVPKDGYLIEAPYQIAINDLVKKEDITAIYTKLENGEIINTLEDEKALESKVIHYRLDKINLEIEKQNFIIIETTVKVNQLRQELGLSGEENNIPSVEINKKREEALQSKRELLDKKLSELLKFDQSKKYEEVIEKVKQSKIDWANSDELARRLKLKGANEDDVSQIKEWLVNNTLSAKTFVLEPKKIEEVASVLSEMSGEKNILDGRAFHIPGGRNDIPEYIKSAVVIPENISTYSLSHQENYSSKTINYDDLHHEIGHVVQDGLLESELYKDWNPAFKSDAPDREYIGLINETDTRVRSMFRELAETFNPSQQTFGQEQLDILKNKLKEGILTKDTRDLLQHYDDKALIDLANNLPAI